MFFEKIKKVQMNRDLMNTIIMANCLVYTSPAADSSDARNKNRAFQGFMDSLDWEAFERKAEEASKPKTAENTAKRFLGGTGLGIPFRDRSKKKGDT